MTENTEVFRVVENGKSSTKNDEIKHINIAKRNEAILQASALNLKCVPLKTNQQLIEKYKIEQIEDKKYRIDLYEKASGKEPIPKDWTNPTVIESYNKNLINFYFDNKGVNEYGNLGLLLWYNHLVCVDLDTKYADQIKNIWESYFEGIKKSANEILVNKHAKKITKILKILNECPVMRSSSNHLQFLIPLQKNVMGMERKQISLEDKEIIEFLCNKKQTVIPPSICSKIKYNESGEEIVIYENFERFWLDQRDLTTLKNFNKDSEKASISDLERFIEFCNQTLVFDLEIKERLTKEEQEEEDFYDFEAELIEILQRCFQKGYIDGNHHHFILHLSLILKYHSVYIDTALSLFKSVCQHNKELLTENSIKTVKEVYKRYDRYSQKELIALLGDELFTELRECLKSANLNNVNCLLKSKYGDKLVTLFYDKITLKYNDRIPIPLYSFNNLDLIAKYEYQNDVIYKVNIDGKTLDKNKPEIYDYIKSIYPLTDSDKNIAREIIYNYLDTADDMTYYVKEILGFDDGWKLPDNYIFKSHERDEIRLKILNKVRTNLSSEYNHEENIRNFRRLYEITDVKEKGVIFAWYFASPFYNDLKTVLSLDPLLCIYGEKGKGKSMLTRFIVRSFTSKDALKTRDNMDTKARLSQNISTSTFPIVIDDAELINKNLVDTIKSKSTVGANNEKLGAGKGGQGLASERLMITPISMTVNSIPDLLKKVEIGDRTLFTSFTSERKDINTEWVDLEYLFEDGWLFSIYYDRLRSYNRKSLLDIINNAETFDLTERAKNIMKLLYLGKYLAKIIFNIEFDISQAKEFLTTRFDISNSNLRNFIEEYIENGCYTIKSFRDQGIKEFVDEFRKQGWIQAELYKNEKGYIFTSSAIKCIQKQDSAYIERVWSTNDFLLQIKPFYPHAINSAFSIEKVVNGQKVHKTIKGVLIPIEDFQNNEKLPQ